MMVIGTLSLTGVGIPHLGGFAGFHSKDAIIEASFAAHTPNNYAFWLLVVAAFMTAFYSWRLIFMTFHGHARADHHTYEHAHESPFVMLIVLAALALGSIVAGFAFQHYFIGEAYKEFWGKALFEGAHNHILHALHEVPDWVGWAPTLAMLGGFALAYLFYIAALAAGRNRTRVPPHLPVPSQQVVLRRALRLAVRAPRVLDRSSAVEARRRHDHRWAGADGIANRVLWTTGRVVKLQTGYVYHYAFAMLIGVALIITAFMFAGSWR
jgi:NADH-quinone oxidoreductase subunit L